MLWEGGTAGFPWVIFHTRCRWSYFGSRHPTGICLGHHLGERIRLGGMAGRIGVDPGPTLPNRLYVDEQTSMIAAADFDQLGRHRPGPLHKGVVDPE